MMQSKNNQVAKDFMLAIMLCMLFNSQFTLVFAQNQENAKPEQQTIRETFTCEVDQLSPEDSFRLLNLLADGFTGDQLSSALPSDEEIPRDKLRDSTVVIPLDPETGEAQKVDLADEKFHISEALHLANDWIKGPYAFGFVLTDTLRVGRCKDLEDKNIPCPVSGSQLALRNSGVGITSDFKPMAETIKDIIGVNKDVEDITDEEYTRIREQLGLPADAEEDLKMRLAFTDLNDANVETLRRVPGELIPNSILAGTFNAYGQTTCNTTDCIINVYSLFDKYYNNWFSTKLTLSVAGPTLVSKAGDLFSHMGLKSTFPFRLSETEIANKIRMRLFGPDTYFGKKLRADIKFRRAQYPEVGKLHHELVKSEGWNKGYDLLTNPGLQHKISGDWLSSGGWLTKVDDPIIRRELFKYAKDIDRFTKTQRAFVSQAKKNYTAVRNTHGFGSSQEVAARIDYSRTVSRSMLDYTDSLPLDAPGWFAKNSPTGLYTQSVSQVGATSPAWLASDPTYIYDVLHKYSADGHFGGVWPHNTYETVGDKLKMWRLSPTAKRAGDPLTYSDLEAGFYHYKDLAVKLDTGNVMPIDEWSMPLIKKQMTGPQPVFAQVMTEGKQYAGELGAEDFASKLLESRNILNLEVFAPKNAEFMRKAFGDRGFALRRYTSLLDRSIAYQDKFFHNYFRPVGGLKWTGLFNVYWLGKRGFNQKFASAYMLPDTWREVRWPLGQSEVYNDAFIDFFSHEGSDQGDMFKRMLGVMPWEWLAKNVFANFKPLNDIYERFKGDQIRNTVENLAFYASTPEDCPDCGVTVRSGMDYRYFLASFYTGWKINAYILEDPVSEEALRKGTTLITYSHHTDLEGKDAGATGSTRFSLDEAIREGDTCRDAVENITMGLFPSSIDPSAIGGALAFSEMLGYKIFGFAGVFGTAVQQIVLAPSLQNCIDVDGGYYTHIFVPSKEEPDKGKAPSQEAADTALTGVESFTDQFTSMFRSDSNSYTAQAAEKLNEQVQAFVSGSRQSDLVQANVHIENSALGTLEGEELFSFWFKGETSPTSYKTEGQKVITSDENRALVVDFENGRILLTDLNGEIIEVISDNNIASRLTSTNTAIPAEEIPKRFTMVGLPDSNEPMFEMGLDSELIVLIPEIAECIVQGVEYQTGLEFPSPNIDRLNLTDVFGKTLGITTDTHNIRAAPNDQRMVAEGVPRLMAYGSQAHAKVYANRRTTISNDSNQETGLFESVQFENGVILYKPDSHELIIWLKRHEEGRLPQGYVDGITPREETVIDPETQCPVPAVSLNALPTEPEGLAAYKVAQFNKALEHSGPFNVIETPSRRFVFFSKYEPDGVCVGIECCQDYISIIDKETGEVYEAPIDEFRVTPDGIHVKDAHGREHDIGLTADDGRPMVVYNNYPPEPLTSMQGPQGSFWYDPATGMWHAENAQLLPLLEAFKAGALTQVDPDGQVVTRSGDNIMNVQPGVGPGPFDLPTIPTGPIAILAYIVIASVSIASIQILIKRKKAE